MVERRAWGRENREAPGHLRDPLLRTNSAVALPMEQMHLISNSFTQNEDRLVQKWKNNSKNNSFS